MSKWLKAGDTVRLKEDYDGYFRDLKGRDLTVSAAFPKQEGAIGRSVTIKEIEETHLILARHFTKI